MPKPKKTPKKENRGRKKLPHNLKKTSISICLKNEQWDEIFQDATKDSIHEDFWIWYKTAKAVANQFETVNTKD